MNGRHLPPGDNVALNVCFVGGSRRTGRSDPNDCYCLKQTFALVDLNDRVWSEADAKATFPERQLIAIRVLEAAVPDCPI